MKLNTTCTLLLNHKPYTCHVYCGDFKTGITVHSGTSVARGSLVHNETCSQGSLYTMKPVDRGSLYTMKPVDRGSLYTMKPVVRDHCTQ